MEGGRARGLSRAVRGYVSSMAIRGLAVCVAVATCLVLVPAASAAPRPGERYDGRSATGQRVFLTVRADGSRLERYTFVVRTRCTDGRRRTQGLLHPGERPVPIDAAGGFSHRSPAYRGVYGRVRGRLRLSFSGTFDAAGDTATGTIEATFRSGRFDCTSGPVAFTVHRDGTAGAPWRDSLMATGTYRARGRGIAAVLRALSPGRELSRGTIRYRSPCRSGGTLSSGRTFLRYPLTERGRLRVNGRANFRIPSDQVQVRSRFRLTLRFFGGGRVTGAWRVRAVVRRGGRAIDTCRMNRSFSGRFRSGPA
jgi:hypothetical protein